MKKFKKPYSKYLIIAGLNLKLKKNQSNLWEMVKKKPSKIVFFHNSIRTRLNEVSHNAIS